ncbi:MAG: ATP-binding protein [Caldilineaceae bacterium]|nr:ATP-binding protein [Caldilineaceae bacterium]
MKQTGDPALEIAALQQRMSLLSEAVQRINADLDFDNVLQGVADSARALTGARYGVIVTLNNAGQPEDLVTSGASAEERKRLRDTPGRMQFFDYLSNLPSPLRISDFHAYVAALGLPDFQSVPVAAFMADAISHRGERVGYIFLGRGPGKPEFDKEDEETLATFAAQAALVITNARRYREEQLARNSLETLIDTSPVGVVVFDARTGAVNSINREGRRIVSSLCMPGQSAEQLLNALTFRRPDGREISLQEFPIVQVLSTSETLRAEELVLTVPDGRAVTVLVNATPILSETGELESTVVTVQDLTPLEALERMRAEFLAMVSHELRAPLTSIKGSADTLLESPKTLDPAEMVQFIRIIKTQSERMQSLIGELLDVARIETGALSVSPNPAEISALVDEARNTFLSGGGRDNIAIDLEPHLPPAMADTRRIVQVLTNLLDNAARHSPASSVIQVKAARRDKYVAISVTDQGRGIAAERLPILFRKFTRITDEVQHDDTGLGLAICKGIVEAHGGRIWAESDGANRGSTFTFTLPATTGPGHQAPINLQDASDTDGPPQSGKTQILVVDDDPMTLRYVRDTLSKAGFAPLVTADPDEAFRLVESEPVRLVLLDLMLPGSDGIELMKAILDNVELPVIFLSAYGRDEIIARALESGAADYVVKPFSSTELVARIEAALRRRLVPAPEPPSEPFHLRDLSIDYRQHTVTLAGQPVKLTPTEYKLLCELSINAGSVVKHEQLLRNVWGMDAASSRGALRTYVRRLRRKLNEDAGDPSYIIAVPGIGYRISNTQPPA